MRFTTTIILLTLLTTWTFGQEIEVTVRVIDKVTSKPIKNANVIVLGTTRGTTTNALGFFKLKLGPSERKFVVSHVTYRTEPITVPDGVTSFTVPMEKMSYRLATIDLHEYPTKFKSTDLKPKPVMEVSRLDSFKVVESLADFPYEGELDTFYALFGNEFQFPEKELLNKTEGVKFFIFTISKNGDYENAKCLLDTADAFCPEFKRIISKMPKWIPAEQRGEPMEQSFFVRISYGMNDYWKKKIKEIEKQRK
ncbi:MAG: carboxypeptidase-like regulatory domain-containing protein [Bacteroidetes bacterium]|nr:carboxypeptidase-like regulatory domain-containing protein [Bacteroidota bacterium]